MIFNETMVYPFRVEFDDIDAGGVVHHPKYLNFIERARCDGMRQTGYSFNDSLRDGFVFVVAETYLRYLNSARFEQNLFVLSRLVAARKSSVKVVQVIVSTCPDAECLRSIEDNLHLLPYILFSAQIRLVCVKSDFRPSELSANLKKAFRIPDSSYFQSNPDKQKIIIGPI